MIFTFENLSMQVLVWSYLSFLLIKRNAFQQLQDGLCDEFDSFSCEIHFFESAFQCANTICSCSCHLQSQKTFTCKFLKHCGERPHTKNRKGTFLLL